MGEWSSHGISCASVLPDNYRLYCLAGAITPNGAVNCTSLGVPFTTDSYGVVLFSCTTGLVGGAVNVSASIPNGGERALHCSYCVAASLLQHSVMLPAALNGIATQGRVMSFCGRTSEGGGSIYTNSLPHVVCTPLLVVGPGNTFDPIFLLAWLGCKPKHPEKEPNMAHFTPTACALPKPHCSKPPGRLWSGSYIWQSVPETESQYSPLPFFLISYLGQIHLQIVETHAVHCAFRPWCNTERSASLS